MSEPVAAEAQPSHGSPTRTDGSPDWWRVALGGGGGMFVGMGLGRFSYTAMVPALISSGQLTTLEAGRVGTLNLIGFVFGALISVPLRTRLNERRALTVAVIVSVLALVASAAPLGFAWLGLCRAVVGASAGVIMVLCLALMASAAPSHRRGVAASFVFAGVGVAILSTGILVPLLLQHGLVAAWLGLAACAGAAAALAIWGWQAAPTPTVGAVTPQTAPPPIWDWPLRLLLLGHLCFSWAIVPHTLYWVDFIARGLDRGIGEGGMHWSLVGVASILGPWFAAWLGLRLGTVWALTLAFLLLGFGIAAPLFSTVGAVLVISSLLFGAQPGLSTLLAARVRDLADAEHMPRLMRAMIVASSVGSVTAGAVLPQIYEATQSHVLLFALGGGVMILGTVLVAPWNAEHGRGTISRARGS